MPPPPLPPIPPQQPAAQPGQRHGFDVAPPDSVASPHGIEFDDGQECWWRPTRGEIWRHLGYRRLLFLPAVALLVLSVMVFFDLRLLQYFWWLGFKWSVLLIALPFALAAGGIAGVIRARKDLFCIHCGYSLEGLPDFHHCPECGRQFSLAQCEEYRRDPRWFIHRWRERHKMPPAHGQITAGSHQSKRRRKDGT